MTKRFTGVYVRDLADQRKDEDRADEVLYCPVCGSEYSADRKYYSYLEPDCKLRCYCLHCCGGRPTDLLLVERYTINTLRMESMHNKHLSSVH